MKHRFSRTIRTLQRLAVIAWATMVVFQIIPDVALLPVLPGMSPFLAICGGLGARVLTLTSLFCVPVLLISLFRKRWFCRNLCPAGLLTEYASKLRRRAPAVALFPPLNRWIVWLTLAGAACGYPLFLWLDPLSMFNGSLAAWRTPFSIWGTFPAGLLLVAIVLSVWRPHAWCLRVCPLGYTQALIRDLPLLIRNRLIRRAAAETSAESTGALHYRRSLLGIGLGGALAYVARQTMGSHPGVIRPPAAAPDDRFAVVCVRCGSCLHVCPQNLIRPDNGTSGLLGVGTPIVEFNPGYCLETCTECTRVCPSGAIRRLLPSRKSSVAMGTAQIDKKKCYAWFGESCSVCIDSCPYKAIAEVTRGTVTVPEIKGDQCTGCGLCILMCPASAETMRIISRKV